MSDLPEPDADARQHSGAVTEYIRQQMTGGRLGFADYMQLALYAPGLGYYMAGAPRFGAAGDFVTAPGVSPLFGRCLAAQCVEVLTLCGGDILELGAGRGELAASLLGALPPQSARHYCIVEPSAALRDEQRRTLVDRLGEAALAQVRWLDALPSAFCGIVLANEVMDALPVERFVTVKGRACPLQVQVAGDGSFTDYLDDSGGSASAAAVQAAVAQRQATLGRPLADGYRSEVNLLLAPWLHSLAECVERGVLLLIDYGYPRQAYYLPERRDGTFACYYRHRQHSDPYWYPGLQDMTAHVDFTAVAEAGTAAGLDLLGYTSQASLLLSLGLLRLAEQDQSAAAGQRQRLAIAQAVKTLTLPGEMGERFQAIAFGKDYDATLCGFAGLDLSHSL